MDDRDKIHLWFGLGIEVIVFGMQGLEFNLPPLFYWVMIIGGIGLILYSLRQYPVLLAKDLGWRWPIYRGGSSTQDLLSFWFHPDSCFDSIPERHPLFPSDEIKRKRYWVEIRCSEVKDVPNVSIEFERAMILKKDGGEMGLRLGGRQLKFESTGRTIKRFSPGMSDRIFVLSCIYGVLLGPLVRIEGMGEEIQHAKGDRYLLCLKITGVGVTPPIRPKLLVWLDANNEVHMILESQ